ncbi:aconitate hydratase [Candidatus Uhrbacteria bacterium]|nr:aconitate hydratase [Candidatus Uhrbacteria bacterium]
MNHMNLAQKIISQHLVAGNLRPGEQIALRVDQTLTQDATGTMAYLQFEAMGIPRVRSELSVSYVDHNMLQTDFMNADDHRFLQSLASRYGIYFSRPGNGICHQVHLERFSAPGKTLLGSDSHTPTSGGAGMLAIGAGGLDVALAMAGEPFYLTMPRVVGVRLVGSLQPFVTAKDIILELLRRLTVKGGLGKIFEYFGPGLALLRVPERATIANMGAELGATTSLFPSDQQTKAYLKAQGRAAVYEPLAADPEAAYDEVMEIKLNTLEPLIACPQSPDNVKTVAEVAGTPVTQVAIGSCTNSSYMDLMTVAKMLEGQTVPPAVTLGITPGSRQVMQMIARDGGLATFIAAGARWLESACGPCIGMGFAPPSGGVSVRSFNRNFPGRSGTKDDQVYLASPETAVACALRGVITDPRDLGIKPFRVELPASYIQDDNMIIPPVMPQRQDRPEIIRGPNIKPLPVMDPLPGQLQGAVLIKVGDNISTDTIMPAGSRVLPLRSNLPAIAEFTFEPADPTFSRRAKEKGGGFVVGGSNYGQGSSREHAALAPRYLGVRAVITKSFARIHQANLVNFGILPLTFVNPADYDMMEINDELMLGTSDLNQTPLILKNLTKLQEIKLTHSLAPRELEIIRAGGSLAFVKAKREKLTELISRSVD